MHAFRSERAMSAYRWFLFLHVLGATSLFASIALEMACSLLPAAPLSRVVRRLAPAAMVLTLVSGAWMMRVVWGPHAWLFAGLVGLVAMGAAGFVWARRVARGRGDRLLVLALSQRVSIGVAVLALMTLRPEDATAWLVLAGGTGVGLLIASLASSVRAVSAR
jgi:hypothetical protein